MRIVAVIFLLAVALMSFATALVSKNHRVRKVAWFLMTAMLLGAALAWWLVPLMARMAPPTGVR